MRIKLTKYGLPEVLVIPSAILATMLLLLILPLKATTAIIIESTLAIILLWTLAFFRDPARSSPDDKNLLLAPADGKITEIGIIEENNCIKGPALRIAIFLSIFDVHINRAPCNVKIKKITYKKGEFKNAAYSLASRVNEANNIEMVRTDHPKDILLLRQISGAIARRIVCHTQQGQELTGGQKFGMIKFGSRTELYLPAQDNITTLVNIGDKVKAGITPLIKYE